MSGVDEEEGSSFFGKLKSFYYKVEDKYYAVLDNLFEKGVDLYKYFVEPIESRGVPSFPVAIALLLVLLGGIIYGASLTLGPTTGNLTISVSGTDLDSIPVTLVIDGTDFATKDTVNRTVSFDGVPLNRQTQIKITQEGYAPVLKTVSLRSASNTETIRLSSTAVEIHDFLVTLLDSVTGQPVRDATISFESLTTGVTGTINPQSDGTAVIKLDSLDAILSLNIQSDNYEASQRSIQAHDGQVTIQLVPLAVGDDPRQPIRGTVVVTVTDQAGNPVGATVELYQENTTTALAADNVESGVARFENVAPVGTNVYAIIKPTNEAYLQTQTTVSQITGDEPLEIQVQVENATAASSQQLLITVNGDNGAGVPAANVLIFSSDTNQLITTGTTDETGKISFTLSSTISLENIYVAVNAQGFLPLISTISARQTTLVLSPAAAGNNVEFDAEVLNADSEAASGAKVELADSSGRLFGINQLTGPAGTATFAGIPADTSLRLWASLDSAIGESDIFEVAFAESGEKRVSVKLSRPVGTILVTAQDLVDNSPIENARVTAYADSPSGFSVSNCTTASDGTCLLSNVWANKPLFIVADADGFEPFQSSSQTVSPSQRKQLGAYLVSYGFKNQTFVNLVSLVDDKGKEIINSPTIEKGRIYTARIAASFTNGSARQEIYLRVGEEATVVSDAVVIKSFGYTPSALGAPLSVHSTTFSPGSDCSVDLLNNDVDNQGKKWVAVDYNGVSGVVELSAKIFVKPTADPAKDKLTLNYRAFAVQNGKYSRTPADDELKLERRTPAKDECYAQTIKKEFSLVEGSNVCNEQGTACISVSFTSPQQPQPVGSPFIATVNQPFKLNYEVRNFDSVEGSSAYVKISSTNNLVKLSDFSGAGTATYNDEHTTGRVLLSDAQDLYSGSMAVTGQIPVDYVPFAVEFGDARGPIATHTRAFAVVQGTGALSVTQINPTEFEVGKNKDLRLTVKTSTGALITDATLSFEEENGSPFDGDVPGQTAGDNSPGNGENGQYVIKRIRPTSPGTFQLTVSRDRFVPVSQSLTSKINSFFEFDQPDFISLSCNATSLKVTNTLDVELTADVYVDPACVAVTGPGVTQVSAAGGQDGTAHYRIPNFKPGRTRLLSLTPNSRDSCQVEISATDPRTGSRSLDDPIQIENTCTAFGATNTTNADGIVYINGNAFQPPRLLVDTFSQIFYGSYQPQNYWNVDPTTGQPRYADAASYSSTPSGGYVSAYERMGVIDPITGQPRPEFVDPRAQGAVGVPRDAAVQGGQYGRFGQADQYGNGAFFDISRQNFQRNWTISWVNQDPVAHSFICSDRSGNTVIQVGAIQPGEVVTHVFGKPGLYKCVLENVNQGSIKIKSMCPQKGAAYYARFVTRCMARKAIADSGLFDGGKEHAAKVAASVKTRFTVFGPRIQVDQTDKSTKVDCESSATSGADCKIKITPLVPRNGFGFAIDDRTGKPDYLMRIKDGGTIDKSCFTFDRLDQITSYRSILQPLVSSISAIGLTSAPQYASFAIKFNEKSNCVKLRPVKQADGRTDFRPYIWSPSKQQFLPGDGFAIFELQGNANPNVRYTVKLIIEPTGLLDGRYLFTTIPTTVGSNNLVYRTDAASDPREPGFVINNLPGESVFLLKKPADINPIESKSGTIGILDGNEEASENKLSSLATFKTGFYLCAQNGGCVAQGGKKDPLKPFTAVHPITPVDPKEIAMKLGDVIGNYKFEITPAALPDQDKPFVCSGVNYCSSTTEAQAVDLAQAAVETQLKDQYEFVETFNIDSTMDNMQDGLAGCIQDAMAEMVAQEAQYQMCKTLANFCSGQTYLDPEEEEIEDGESFAGGVTLDSVLGDSQTIVKDIICQETEAGQNLQALRTCLQPGNTACKKRITDRIAGNLKQAQVQSVAQEIPVVDIQRPVINFVTKRIQDNPKAASASINDQISVGGYNVYTFSVDPLKLIGAKGKKLQEDGEVIFAVRPPGYDFSKAIAGISSATAGAAFAPFRLPGQIYDWATSQAASPDSKKLRSLILGFPYVDIQEGTKTHVEFDRYQPTLLTLNKYPVMRAVDNKARETKDDSAPSVITSNDCTEENRPVDPLKLFDPCEEIRDEASQTSYDAAATTDKQPFSRSLVFQAVPSRKGDPLKPVWPAEYGSAPFQVTIPPKYVFESRGEVTKGISAPGVASIPVIGSLLYPEKDASNKFEKLEIPAGDIKRYAVQVTSCKYTRNPLKAGEIILDPSVPNNCNPGQWPISALFPGSTANKLQVQALPATSGLCDGTQACVALQLIGNHLTVAAIDGLTGDTSAAGGAYKPSEKIATTGTATVSLTEIAQDLAKYYSDEAYVPAKLASALDAKDKNGCELFGSPQAALFRCGKSAADLTKPYLVNLDVSEQFLDILPGGIPITVNSQPTGATFISTSIVSVLISYKENKKPTCYTVPSTVSCMFVDDSTKVESKVLAPSTDADVKVDGDAYITLGVFDQASKKTHLITGVKKNGDAVTKDFELKIATTAGGGYVLTPGATTKFTGLEQTVFKQILATSPSSEIDVQKHPDSETAINIPANALSVKFTTKPKGTGVGEPASIVIQMPRKHYGFAFDFGSVFATNLNTMHQSISCGSTPDPREVAMFGLNSRKTSEAYSQAKVEITCASSDGKSYTQTKQQQLFEFDRTGVACPTYAAYKPVASYVNQLGFPGELKACSAKITTSIDEYTLPAKPPESTGVFNFDFSTTTGAPLGAPIGLGAAATCTFEPTYKLFPGATLPPEFTLIAKVTASEKLPTNAQARLRSSGAFTPLSDISADSLSATFTNPSRVKLFSGAGNFVVQYGSLKTTFCTTSYSPVLPVCMQRLQLDASYGDVKVIGSLNAPDANVLAVTGSSGRSYQILYYTRLGSFAVPSLTALPTTPSYLVINNVPICQMPP